MRCSVVIPCYGKAELTRACVTSLLAQADDHELEILLVDNARDPSTQALADPARNVRVLPQPHNLGFAGACNRGLAAARHPFAMVLNNDTQAAPHLLSRLHAALSRDEAIAFAAPVSNRVKGHARLPCGDGGRTEAGRHEIERELCDPASGRIEDADSLSGLCLLGRSATWRELAGFDERFVPGNFEDDDLCLRARLRGWRLVIARDAYLHHEAHQTFQAMGLDIGEEVRRQYAVFAQKWQGHAAGIALLRTIANDPAGAAAAAAIAQRLHPDWPEADWYLGRDLAARDPAAAAVHFEALLRRCPDHLDAMVQLGMCWLDLGEVRRARALWRHASTNCCIRPEQAVDLFYRLGDLAQRRGDFAAAAADFEAALQLNPDDGNLLNRLGAALIELRRFDEALPLLERAAGQGLALAHTNLGICHFHAGAPARALEHFAAAARQLPNDPTAQQNYERARAAANKAASTPT